ncbi:MAG: hypothetical protein ACFFBD_19905, partial [Candidatus Hodarchaeota archaeon]
AEIVESRYNATILISDLTTFVVDTAFVQRGWRNDSESNFTKVYRYIEEPDTLAFSPGDNITLIGRINCSTAPDKFYRTSYMNLTSGRIDRSHWTSQTWNETTFPNIEPISWDYGFLRDYNGSESDPAHGNFVLSGVPPEELQYYYALNFEIPERGIYGKVNFTITTIFFRNHSSMYNPWSYNVRQHEEKIQFPGIEVKYKLNVTENTFDANQYRLTDYGYGNFSIKPLNYNLDKIDESDPIWNLNATINIPLTDIHFTMYMNNSLDEPRFYLFNVHHSENFTFEWISQMNPNLRNGTYSISLEWLDPLKGLNDTFASILDWTSTNTTLYTFTGGPKFYVEIIGSLAFRDTSVINGTLASVTQDNTTDLTCKIWIKESSVFARGLDLYAVLNNNAENGKLAVVERDGVYHIYFSAALNETTGDHTMHFYKRLTDEYLGYLTFTVNEKVETVIPPPPTEGIGVLIGIIGAGAIIAIYIVIIIVFIRPFKKS